eukprot:scpid106614/ scgid22032/ 
MTIPIRLLPEAYHFHNIHATAFLNSSTPTAWCINSLHTYMYLCSYPYTFMHSYLHTSRALFCKLLLSTALHGVCIWFLMDFICFDYILVSRKETVRSCVSGFQDLTDHQTASDNMFLKV